MCATCDVARKLPRPEALKVIARAMTRKGFPQCLDKLVGELVGEPEPTVDRATERAWEKRRGSRG